MKKVNTGKLTQTQRDELAALAQMPEVEIDTRDLPEQREWSGAKRGVFRQTQFDAAREVLEEQAAVLRELAKR